MEAAGWKHAGGTHMPKGERSDGVPRVLSLGHLLGGPHLQGLAQRWDTSQLNAVELEAVDRGDTQGPVITLPYVRGVSEVLCCILTPLGVKVSFRPHTTLRHLLMRPKDCITNRELTGVVYQVPSAGCPATYLGQTSWPAVEWAQAGGGVKRSSHLCTSRVCLGAHHPVDWDKVRVLDHQPCHHQRLALESIHIRSQTRPLNRDKGPMPQIYNSLFSSNSPSLDWLPHSN